MIKISPSILSADFSNLGQDVRDMEAAGVEMLHIDVMDGHFVPNISFGAPVFKMIRKDFSRIFDVHLMISEPLRYIDDFVKAGADIITFHVECDSDIQATIDKIKAAGKKVGLVLKPKTPASVLKPYLEQLDMVLVMTVEPGFGGQSFMYDMMPKVKEIREMITASGKDIDLEVDGGVNAETAKICVENGANVLVAGSYLFKQKGNYPAAVESLR
ncbi:MAG: ribulose-phosphate 3-epimerase [Oscillospiraceae bacterium]|nr:ribulose-phosphate 3-epimerase [Oscillospiraceae bacterium]